MGLLGTSDMRHLVPLDRALTVVVDRLEDTYVVGKTS